MAFTTLAEARASAFANAKIYRNNANMKFYIMDYETMNEAADYGAELHEIIDQTKPTRLFLDIDSNDKIDFEAIMLAAFDVLDECGYLIPSMDDFNIAKYEHDDKHRSHIVFNAVAEN